MSWPDARSNWRPHSNVRRPRRKYLPPLRTTLANAFLMRVAATWMSSPTFPRSAVRLETLREVYHNDQLARQRGLSAEDRLAFHQAEAPAHEVA